MERPRIERRLQGRRSLLKITPDDRKMVWLSSPVVVEGAQCHDPGGDELEKLTPDVEMPGRSLDLQTWRPHRGIRGGWRRRWWWIGGLQISLVKWRWRRWRSGGEICRVVKGS
jgi:hypothetical protein